jgi:hypothetical protein
MARTARPITLVAAALFGIGVLLAAPAAALAATIYIADLSGDQEVPEPGDPDGFGFAELTIEPGSGMVCASIAVEDIEEPVAAHIHSGTEGVAGDIVVTLPTPIGGEVDECVEGLDEATLQAIVDDPGAYYVNVHTTDFQAGAIRGQLGAIAVGQVVVAKYVCPPEIQSVEDLEAAPDGTCSPATLELADPPEGYTWEDEAVLFPDMQITIVDELSELTIDDSEPAEGGTVCNPTTLVCAGSGAVARAWPSVVDGQVDVFQETFPDGYEFGWAEVIASDETDPAVDQERFEDGISFDFDTQEFENGVLVRLFDFAVPAGPPPSAEPSAPPAPTITPPATSTADGPDREAVEPASVLWLTALAAAVAVAAGVLATRARRRAS